MKKRIGATLLLGLLCIFGFSVTVWANDTYTIDELNMTIQAPEGWIVFSRDIDPNDPNLAARGLTKETLEQYYQDDNVYLHMMHPDSTQEIMVRMYRNDSTENVFDFNAYTEDWLLDYGNDETSYYPSDNTEFTGIFAFDSATFLGMDLLWEYSDADVYAKEYFTIINQMEIGITLFSNGAPFSDATSKTLSDTMSSVHFTNVKTKPNIQNYDQESNAPAPDLTPNAVKTWATWGIVLIVVIIVLVAQKKHWPKKQTPLNDTPANQQKHSASGAFDSSAKGDVGTMEYNEYTKDLWSEYQAHDDEYDLWAQEKKNRKDEKDESDLW